MEKRTTEEFEEYKNCVLCPRECGVDRYRKKGVCKSGAELYIAKTMIHKYEEPCLSPAGRSGAVFFSGCPLQCVYCQNKKITSGNYGERADSERLYEIFTELLAKSAENIDLVTPDHYLPHVIKALERAKKEKFPLPFVYNCSGYEKTESLKRLDGLVDIYLTDFKYMDGATAEKYSRAPDYPSVCKEALAEMTRQRGEPVYAKDGKLLSGVIVRHLILPGRIIDAKRIISYINGEYGDKVIQSVMSQYTPPADINYPELKRKITPREYESVKRFCEENGINGFIQEPTSAEEKYIPDF